jgi:hypothetical protein
MALKLGYTVNGHHKNFYTISRENAKDRYIFKTCLAFLGFEALDFKNSRFNRA